MKKVSVHFLEQQARCDGDLLLVFSTVAQLLYRRKVFRSIPYSGTQREQDGFLQSLCHQADK